MAWKPHKYKAKPVKTEEGYFASTKEYNDWQKLRLLERAGAITDLKRQVKFPLNGPAGIRVCDYIADATFIENGQQVCYDSKGMITDVYRIKKKLFIQQYPAWEHREG